MKQDTNELAEEARILRKKTAEIEDKFVKLSLVPDELLTYTLLRAQAEYICDLLLELKLSPFKGFYSYYRHMVTLPSFSDAMMIKSNEFGEMVPDEERLKKYLPCKKPLKEDPYITQKSQV